MKVFLYYEDNDHKMLHKTLKITLPKSWKNGPTSKLLHQFVETYNASDLSKSLTLNADEMHLAHKVQSEKTGEEEMKMIALASDAITIETIEDRELFTSCMANLRHSRRFELRNRKLWIGRKKKWQIQSPVSVLDARLVSPREGPIRHVATIKPRPYFTKRLNSGAVVRTRRRMIGKIFSL
eukprot:205105_1